MKNPYEILGLNEDADEQELISRYEQLKAQYGEQRFKAGEEGNEGARKLTELEEAWQLISADMNKRKVKSTFGSDYGEIDNLIKAGDYSKAQQMLDEISDRTAEWHYLQSIIYYKREWLNDSYSQLKTAVEKDPTNEKYKTALEKLKMVMGNPEVPPERVGTSYGDGTAYNDPDRQMMGGNAMSNCCMTYLCMNCCCNLMSCCR